MVPVVGENINPGMKVTVVRGKKWKSAPRSIEEMFGMPSKQATEIIQHEDRRFHGEVLEVRAVMLPYVVLEQLSGPTPDHVGRTVNLDIREYRLLEVTTEYEREMVTPDKRAYSK